MNTYLPRTSFVCWLPVFIHKIRTKYSLLRTLLLQPVFACLTHLSQISSEFFSFVIIKHITYRLVVLKRHQCFEQIYCILYCSDLERSICAHVIPAFCMCGWSSKRRLSSLWVCERWRFSEVTLSSIAEVFISQDIWLRAAISFPATLGGRVNQGTTWWRTKWELLVTGTTNLLWQRVSASGERTGSPDWSSGSA